MIEKSAILSFPKTLIDKPVISHVIREIDVEVNILRAHITPEEDGYMLAIFSGEADAVDRALSYLDQNEVKVTVSVKNIVWDENKCVHCGACVGQCAPGAFSVDTSMKMVSFDAERCVACKGCIPACSYGAVELIGEHLRREGGAR